MKILITGATGYLGQALVREALARGYEVRGLCRALPQEDSTSGLEWALGDITEPNSLTEAMSGCDAIIHSAALVSIWASPTQFQKVNVTGTESLLCAAADAGVSRVVYTSSFFALGPTTERPADESWFNESVKPPTPYAKSKREAEIIVRQWMAQDFDVIPLYPALVFGPGKATQGNHITQMVQQYTQKKIPGVLGAGDKRWTFSYVNDVAKGHLLALEKGRKGEGYILGGEDATLVEFLEMLQDLTGIPRPKRRIPFAVAKMVALWEEARAGLSKGYVPPLTRDVVDVYKHHWRYSSQKAMAQLGYTRTPLKAGLHRILEEIGFARADRSSLL